MTIQDSTQIGNIIQNAFVFNVKNWSDKLIDRNPIIIQVKEFFELLASRQIEYTIAGDIALLNYIEARNSEALDLIITASSIEKLPEIEITSKDMYFARGQFGALQIDFLLTKNPLFKKVQRSFVNKQQFLNKEIQFATVDGLLLLKLYALPSLYRQGNFARVGIYENDIATLIQAFSPNLKDLTKELEKHLGETDIQEIDNILSDIQKRIDRFQKGSDE